MRLYGSACLTQVLLDADLKPWLIEVNHSPSFNIDSSLDRTVKEQLILDAVQLVSCSKKLPEVEDG